MPLHQRRTSRSDVAVLSWRAIMQRFSFALFLFLSCGLLVMGRTNPVTIQVMRGHIVDGVAPILDIVTRPLLLIEQFSNRLSSYAQLQRDNEQLRTENAQMARWQNMVVALDHENKELRSLLHFKAEPNLSFVTARVIADTGGPFVRALVITAGKLDGAREGMAAMTGEGLVGRVVEVSDHSSVVLMLTDLNSRLPVTLAGSGEHAVVAGNNAPQLKLLYLPQDAVIEDGTRVLTSGHGGVFPPNLPVGTVVNDKRGHYEVVPFAPMGRITYVSLIDFNLAGGASNSIAQKIATDSKKR